MKNLHAAILKTQSEMPALVKDASNPAFRSRYATLAAVQDTAIPVLSKHGLIATQSVRTEWMPLPEEPARLMVYVSVALTHVESSESTGFEVGLPCAKTDPQGVGSAITYGRRFALMTLLGLAPEDDDGNQGSGNRPQPQQQAPAKKGAPDEPEFAAPPEALVKAFHATGAQLYGELWDTKRGELVRAKTKRRTGSSKELSAEEMRSLLDGMQKKLAAAAEAAQPPLVEAPAGAKPGGAAYN